MVDSDDDDMVDMESLEDTLYSEDDVAEFDYGLMENDSTSSSSQSQTSYVVLKEEDIHKQQSNDIEQVSTILSISKVEAIVLLLHYRWCVSKLEDEWFTDEDRVRRLVGLLKKPLIDDNDDDDSDQCGICFESYLRKDILMVSCGHPYCKTCWTGYITTKINDGPGCLMIQCPEPSCSASVGQDMVDSLVKKEVKEKYDRYFFRSYVEESTKKIKWCPSPGCEYAVDFGIGSDENYDVSCLCSYEFCWNCCEDAHRPVDCDTVSKWMLKNKDESENSNWILANTKPCPECKRPIEKNQGCNNMRCYVCKCAFCWNCLGLLSGHTSCNKFEEGKRVMAKMAKDRYIHYYERWAGNQSSRLKAIEDLKKVQTVLLKQLSYKQKTDEFELRFIVEAWIQIIECRRVLKWTYAYGYYLPESEVAKKRFFEYLQGEAESCLERLHHCAEKEMLEFVVMNDQVPSQNFNHFKSKLLGLTKPTKTYFENLVTALENGLSEVAHNKTRTRTRKNSTNSSTKRQKLGK